MKEAVVSIGPRRDDQRATQNQRAGVFRVPTAEEEQACNGYEIEGGFAGQGGQAEEETRGHRGPQAARTLHGACRSLEAPPEEHHEDGFGPEMDREPNELGEQRDHDAGNEGRAPTIEAATQHDDRGRKKRADRGLQGHRRIEAAQRVARQTQ